MKSLITASVLAVTLSGCRDQTPITTTGTASSAAKIKSKRGPVPVPLDRATGPLRPSPRERDAEGKTAALSHAMTKKHSGPDGAHAPAPAAAGPPPLPESLVQPAPSVMAGSASAVPVGESPGGPDVVNAGGVGDPPLPAQPVVDPSLTGGAPAAVALSAPHQAGESSLAGPALGAGAPQPGIPDASQTVPVSQPSDARPAALAGSVGPGLVSASSPPTTAGAGALTGGGAVVAGLVPGVTERVIDFQQMRQLHLDVAAPIVQRGAPAGDNCPPHELRILGSPRVAGVLQLYYHSSRWEPNRRIFISRRVGGPWSGPVVSVVGAELAPGTPLDAMIRDKAFLIMMEDYVPTGFLDVPKDYDIDPDSGISDHCRVRTFVTENIGDESLATYLLAPMVAALYIAQALAIVKRLHSLGFVHGNVKGENFIFSGPFESRPPIRLINFGRAEPYVHASTGVHVDNLPAPNPDGPFPEGGLARLSPWELRGEARMSRRSDIFRLSEMALRIANLDSSFGDAVWRAGCFVSTANRRECRQAVLRIKEDRPCLRDRNLPQIFREFYQYALSLRFDETPEYDRWIEAFTEFANTT